ncbi:hypothetical protein BU26DRAFT_499869 [Trematosphaeria pertusa]|uniref:Uncharacterized protein n=1 Tax=Trematosphaeria pertusa TaxID=390896 RepID=A0A6A6J463_9PLEO|nr:uncharacterized protein BU26DRAFT_499869 [Trematosphaeria pertusa]KAF2257358.1 hypothetical protein BU26DRAFT_499869 [Trematosphaeria pertusa]
MLSSLFRALPWTFGIATSISLPTPSPSPSTLPDSLRECYLTSLPASLIPPFANYLLSQPSVTIPQNMGRVTLQHSVNGTCLQADVYNWSCDHNLTVTGPGLANAVQSIADQCDGRKYESGEVAGPSGFGYYRDLETGDEFTRHLWVVSGGCSSGKGRQSACSPGS